MNNNFSENLKKIRKDNNLSQEQLAEELGVSRQAISKWESATAYPEMDKIIALCDRFNLNIDDLLHKDIRETKGEEESKKNINNTINDFLNFISDSFNLFCNMTLKSKVKCLIEQFVIIILLMIISFAIRGLSTSLFHHLLNFLPQNIYNIFIGIIESVISIFCFIASLTILIHIFKTRYLNYYKDIINNKSEEVIESKEVNTIHTNDKIVIRDPKNSEYHFIQILLKGIILIIKFIAIWIAIGFCFLIITLIASFIISFMLNKTGLFFYGLLITLISSTIICIILLLILLNFIFNRKNEKKMMIWGFIISLITFGIGCGLISIGVLDFEIIKNDTLFETQSKEFKMEENMLFHFNTYTEINYKEENRDNIRIEYNINKYCELKSNEDENKKDILLWISCSDETKMIKEVISELNKKRIISFDNDLDNITIYASKENIEKLKAREKEYAEEMKNRYENPSNIID